MVGSRSAVCVVVLVVVVVGCGSNGSPPVDAPGLMPPAIAVTEHPVAGAPVRCTVVAAATGAHGTVEYHATWTRDGAAFTETATAELADDSVPGRVTHTRQVFACTVVATDGVSTASSAPASVTIEGRFAFLIDQAASPQTLDKIDLDTLMVTVVGPIGAMFSFGDLAWDSKTQELYMVDGQTAAKALYKVDTTTGAATLVGKHNINLLRSLGYDPVLDRMLGGVGMNVNPAIYTLDLTTGAATMLGGVTSTDGLAYDTKRNRMIGVTSSSTSGTFSAVDTATGAFATLASAGKLDDAGLTYDPYLDVFWAATAKGEILQYDPVDFARTSPKLLDGQQFASLAIALPR